MSGIGDFRDMLMLVADAERRTATLMPAWEVVVSLVYSSAISLNLAPREVDLEVADAKVGDRVQIYRAARPSFVVNGVASAVVGGILIEEHAVVWTAGKVPVVHVIPAITLGAQLRVPLRLIGYRPAA